ncbi:MAG: hypothetical protein NUW01_01720 [Gemmatimonadaceae bacterium]|nr:hypothetical protein [Gemmatimonadaceae bacterium]
MPETRRWYRVFPHREDDGRKTWAVQESYSEPGRFRSRLVSFHATQGEALLAARAAEETKP